MSSHYFWLIRTIYTSNYAKITCKIATWQLWAKLLVLKLHIAFFLCTKPSDIQIIWEKNVMSCCPNMQRNDWMIEIILFCNFGVPTSTKAIHEISLRILFIKWHDALMNYMNIWWFSIPNKLRLYKKKDDIMCNLNHVIQIGMLMLAYSIQINNHIGYSFMFLHGLHRSVMHVITWTLLHLSCGESFFTIGHTCILIK